MKVIIIGMPGSGKSSLAAEISTVLDLKHIDSDLFIENKYNLSINEIFTDSGEKKFREYEHEALKEILKEDHIVLSTGGGMPCFLKNMELMNNAGITVYLDVSVEILMQRIINDTYERPLIIGKSDIEIKEYLDSTLKNREQFYLKAKHIVNAKHPIAEVLQLLLFNY